MFRILNMQETNLRRIVAKVPAIISLHSIYRGGTMWIFVHQEGVFYIEKILDVAHWVFSRIFTFNSTTCGRPIIAK